MNAYNVAEAKAQFSELVSRAEAGESMNIKRRGRTVARLVPVEPALLPIDFEELARVRALGKPDSMTVEEMRRRDLL